MPVQSLVRLTRRVTFSSGHRYWHVDLTAEENRERYGEWASPYNHGHNYILDVEVVGQLDPANGMVVNIKVIDDVLKREILKVFHNRSINDEVPGFDRTAPCVENLMLDIAQRLNPSVLPPEVKLTRLRLEEMPLFYGGYDLETDMITLTRVYEFAASHRLNAPNLDHETNLALFGKCNNVNGHGHNYLLEVTVTGKPDPTTGFLCSLDDLDAAVKDRVVDRFDHKNLDLDLPEFNGLNTTSEVVASKIFELLDGQVPAKLYSVRLHETARNIFEVKSDSI